MKTVTIYAKITTKRIGIMIAKTDSLN